MGKVITKTFAASTDAPYTQEFTSINPTTSFKIIDICPIFNVTPTTSEVVTIKSITALGDEKIEDNLMDPSNSDYTGKPRRFEKEFSSDTTIEVSFPNTEANALTLIIMYEVLSK